MTDSLIPDGLTQPERSKQPERVQTRIRQANLADLPALAVLLTDSFHSPGRWLRWLSPVLQAGLYQDLRNRVLSSNPHYACLVAEINWRLGSVTVLGGTVEVALRSTFPWQPRTCRYPYLSNLAVERRHRRSGIGQQLLLASERTVQSWGFSELYLHVLENNLPARRLYTKAGYQLQTIEADWLNWAIGRPRRLLLRKSLSLNPCQG